MLVAIGVSLALVAHLRRVARQTESQALRSDALHYATDVYTNSGALLALLIIVLTGWTIVDPLISIVIALYIFRSAAAVGRESFDVLMDRRLPIDIDEQVATIVTRFKHEGVLGFHDLRTRRSGSKVYRPAPGVERDHVLKSSALTVRVLRAIEAEIPRSRVQIIRPDEKEKVKRKK